MPMGFGVLLSFRRKSKSNNRLGYTVYKSDYDYKGSGWWCQEGSCFIGQDGLLSIRYLSLKKGA